MRFRWVQVRLAALLVDELRELLTEAWRMCVPKKVAASYAVPTLDERLVHLVDVREGSVAVADDVAVPEVQISGEPPGHANQHGGR